MTMELYGYQKKIARLIRQGESIILQAPTGAGKTMAALWPFLLGWAAGSSKVPRKCVYAVPMRVLANQFEADYNRIVYEDLLIAKPPIIAKQTGEYKQDPEFLKDLTFATIDQVLSSWLIHPYSLSARKGNLNAGAFVGSYLIFDEFHLFDPDSTWPVNWEQRAFCCATTNSRTSLHRKRNDASTRLISRSLAMMVCLSTRLYPRTWPSRPMTVGRW